AALWAIPAVQTVAALSSPVTGLGYLEPRLVQDGPYVGLTYGFTWLDSLAYVYDTSLLVAAVGALATYRLAQPGAFRVQFVVLLPGLLLPLLSAVLFLAGIRVFGQRDSMPFAFAGSSVLVTYGLVRGRLFDLVPVAYEAVVTASPDPMVVIDPFGRIV